MKKSVLLVIATMVGFTSFGQGPLTKNWEILGAATGSLVGTGGLQTTIAYNKVTDKLYLPVRNSKIDILDPSTGALLSTPKTLATLTTSPAWTQSFKYTKVRTTTDGVIYSCNMIAPAGPPASQDVAGKIYIYRWASEADLSPTASEIDITGRVGDSFAVTGTGANTVIYIGGANNPLLFVLKTADGVTFTLSHAISLGVASDARSSISAVSNSLTSDLWINTLNVEAKRITSNIGGTITSSKSVSSAVINQIYANAEYIQEGTEKYLAVSGAHNATLGIEFKLYKITDFASPPTTGVAEVGTGILGNPPTTPFTYVTNANAYADVAYKKNSNGTFTFYNLISNNGLVAYTTATALPVTLTSFTASLANNQNTLNWATSSENNSLGFEIESSDDGLVFNKIGFVPSKSSGNSSAMLSYSFQDKSANTGTTYYRLKQIDKDGKSDYSDIKFIKNPLAGSSAFAIYPNPTTDYVEIAGANAAGITMQLFTTTGKEVNITNLVQGSRLNMAGLNAGIYVLSISENGRLLQTSKVVKK